MSLHVNSFIWFISSAFAQDPHLRISAKTERVYAHPSTRFLKGMIPSKSSFLVEEVVKGTSSCPQGWGRVHKRGFVCLDHTHITTIEPAHKDMLSFIPPDPLEYEYDFSNPPTLSFDLDTEPFVPHIHARILDGSRGRLWASAEAYENGDSPNWRLKEEREYRFVDVIETERGLLLERPNGRVTPVAEWYVYPVSSMGYRKRRCSNIWRTYARICSTFFYAFSRVIECVLNRRSFLVWDRRSFWYWTGWIYPKKASSDLDSSRLS
jgi:hypothetical protein